MTRTELLSKSKPILFNTEMVRAILDGRKTQTRRVCKVINPYNVYCYEDKEIMHEFFFDADGKGFYCKHCGLGVTPPHCRIPCGQSWIRPQYTIGDYLYVRETWTTYKQNGKEYYIYRTGDNNKKVLEEVGNCYLSWNPSIHMPKEAARIFLRVKSVRVERLQDIDDDGVVAERFEIGAPFDELWDSTIKKSDHDKYGWKANPWVWVYEFERVICDD